MTAEQFPYPADLLSRLKLVSTRKGHRSGVIVTNTQSFYLNVSKIVLNTSGLVIPATADMGLR
ncbi:MAG: hypothetical protein ACSLEN_07555 [Candidatus Malihini olakiniferum]